jgi:hypothetical protein
MVMLVISLTFYKKLNNLKSYKISKLKFANELDILVMKDIVIKFDDDPARISLILMPK